MCQWLRAFATFPEDPTLVASIQVWQLTISSNSSSVESDSLCHEWLHMNTCTNFKKYSYKKGNEELPASNHGPFQYSYKVIFKLRGAGREGDTAYRGGRRGVYHLCLQKLVMLCKQGPGPLPGSLFDLKQCVLFIGIPH